MCKAGKLDVLPRGRSDVRLQGNPLASPVPKRRHVGDSYRVINRIIGPCSASSAYAQRGTRTAFGGPQLVGLRLLHQNYEQQDLCTCKLACSTDWEVSRRHDLRLRSDR